MGEGELGEAQVIQGYPENMKWLFSILIADIYFSFLDWRYHMEKTSLGYH